MEEESNCEVNDLFSLLFIATPVDLWLRPLLETLLIAIHRRRVSRTAGGGNEGAGPVRFLASRVSRDVRL